MEPSALSWVPKMSFHHQEYRVRPMGHPPGPLQHQSPCAGRMGRARASCSLLLHSSDGGVPLRHRNAGSTTVCALISISSKPHCPWNKNLTLFLSVHKCDHVFVSTFKCLYFEVSHPFARVALCPRTKWVTLLLIYSVQQTTSQ